MNHKKFFIVIACIAIAGNILIRIPLWVNRLNHDGKFLEDVGIYNGYEYYNSIFDDAGIYRKEVRSKEYFKISDLIILNEEDVYFENSNMYFTSKGMVIYSIDLELLKETALTHNNIQVKLLGYYNNTLYFSNYSDNGYLYSISTDSKNLKKIADADVNQVNIEEGKVYFQSYNSGQKYVYDIENETVREINE